MVPDVYEILQTCHLPVYLYGTGDGALKIHAALQAHGISVSGVFASDGFVRERSFLGFPVESLAAVEQKHPRIAAVLCFGLEEGESERILSPLMQKHLVVAPALPVYGDGCLDHAYLLSHREQFERIYGWLADDDSRNQYEAVLRYHASGDPRFLLEQPANSTPPDAYYAHSLAHIDVGAYDGDTAREYLLHNPRCTRLLAFEPDAATFRKLVAQTDPAVVQCFPFACGEKDGSAFLAGSGRGAHCDETGHPVTVRSLDSVCGYPFIQSAGIPVGSVKIDAEGLDAQVLAGAANLITACNPVLCVSAYHRAYDLLDLPILLKQLRYRSKLFFRRKNCVPAWDTAFYLV